MDQGSGLGSGAGAAGPDPKKLEEKEPEEAAELVLDQMTNLQIRGESKTDALAENSTPSKADIFVAMATVEGV